MSYVIHWSPRSFECDDKEMTKAVNLEAEMTGPLDASGLHFGSVHLKDSQA